jgi:hypothetical protein
MRDRRMATEMLEEPIVKVSDDVYQVDVQATVWSVRFTVPEEYPFEPPVAAVRRTDHVGQWLPVGPVACTPAMTLMGYARSLVTELDARGSDLRERADVVFEDAIREMHPERSSELFGLAEDMEKRANAFNDTT